MSAIINSYILLFSEKWFGAKSNAFTKYNATSAVHNEKSTAAIVKSRNYVGVLIISQVMIKTVLEWKNLWT